MPIVKIIEAKRYWHMFSVQERKSTPSWSFSSKVFSGHLHRSLFPRAIRKTVKTTFIILLTVLLFACSASSQFSRSAQEQNLLREDITVNSLPLVIFRDEILADSSTIHFYIDGDGTPWIAGRRIANDPTTRSRIILDLIAADPAKSILVGRPCYYLAPRNRPEICHDKWWTSHRYSRSVVTVMSKAIVEQIQRFSPERVQLLGYSGGGTLAMLIAKEIGEKIDCVITIAANLDVDRWIEMHQFSPLARSLNAENFPILSAKIQQVHFVGSEDENVPAEITKAVASRQPDAELVEIEGYAHECCWPKDWASRLRQVSNNN